MLIWVIYDIQNNRTRNHVARKCKNVGLYRVQKSAFLGEVEENTLDELKIQLEDLIDLDKDSVYIFPMSRAELNKAGLLGQAFDRKLITDEIISKFF